MGESGDTFKEDMKIYLISSNNTISLWSYFCICTGDVLQEVICQASVIIQMPKQCPTNGFLWKKNLSFSWISFFIFLSVASTTIATRAQTLALPTESTLLILTWFRALICLPARKRNNQLQWAASYAHVPQWTLWIPPQSSFHMFVFSISFPLK